MKKFSNVFFASDFDHTLTAKDNTLNKRNIEAIEYLMSEGGIFTVASGRSIPLFRKRAAMVPVNAPCILYNGAACYDYQTRTLHYLEPLGDIAMEVVEKALSIDPQLCVEIQGVENHYVFGKNELRDAFLKGEGFSPVQVTGGVPKPWVKVAISGMLGRSPLNPVYSPEELAHFDAVQEGLTAYCADRCYVTRSLAYVLEIGNPTCSKGKAARKLAEDCGRKILVCAGDAPNDLPMLQEADFAFVPADHEPTLDATPFRVVAPCGEGAVADAIEQLERIL